MVIKRLIGFVLLNLLFASLLEAQSVVNYYWVAFPDKTGTEFSVDSPEMFLSARAIARREKQGITIDETDLPVSAVYTDSLARLGVSLVHESKWLNGCTIQADSALAKQISELGFVVQVQLTKPGITSKSLHLKWEEEETPAAIDTSLYGESVYQIGQLNGQFLHNQGYTGAGIEIAVLDAGFYNVDEYDAFVDLISENRILGTRDFVTPGNNVYDEHYHGMSVLSTMAGNLEGELIGTASQASYYLLRTEDVDSEFLVEEDNWVAAAEYADSLGMDLINSSLGYSQFDDSTMNHTYADMDGATARVTKAADMAVQKGILVCASAGNEAGKTWRYLVAPSDGNLVLGVGAVGQNGVWASFSSLGPAANGAVKPNVAAMGLGTTLVNSSGTIGKLNGTSFSSPVLAGMAACLWQANPDATALELKAAIEQSGSQYLSPDTLLGYGIPDFEIADQLLKQEVLGVDDEIEIGSGWRAYPNPFVAEIYFENLGEDRNQILELTLTNLSGAVVFKKKLEPENNIVNVNLGMLARGIYIAGLRSANKQVNLKVVKIDQQN